MGKIAMKGRTGGLLPPLHYLQSFPAFRWFCRAEPWGEGMDFFANVSHEFRTPLTLISSASGALKSNGSKDQNKLLHVIRRNTQRMLMLVNQLLDFNKIEHNALSLSVSETDISGLTEDIVHSFSFSAEQKNINLECFGFEDKLTGWLDCDKYEKVLYNLLSNALGTSAPPDPYHFRPQKQPDGGL